MSDSALHRQASMFIFFLLGSAASENDYFGTVKSNQEQQRHELRRIREQQQQAQAESGDLSSSSR